MAIAGVPLDFVLFALTLLGVALFHSRTLQVALTGAAARPRSTVENVMTGRW